MKVFLLSLALTVTPLFAQELTPAANKPAADIPAKLAPGAKIFIDDGIEGGFRAALSAAILKKQTPVRVMDSRDKADFILMGYAKEEKAGWAKTIFVSPAPHAEASVELKEIKSGEMVWAYSVDKPNAARATQSTAEACAKHLKQFIEKNDKAK